MKKPVLGLVMVLIANLPAFSGTAGAVAILDFEGLKQFERVLDFYNGGLGEFGSGPGTNFGVSFATGPFPLFHASIDCDASGANFNCGNFGGEPSPDTALLAGTGNMNVPAGFDTGFSFFYSSPNFDPSRSITIYDGLNGTGNILATLNLPNTPLSGAPDPNGGFSPFVPLGISFDGIAKSVRFNLSSTFFDNLTLGSASPVSVPEPTALLLLGSGIFSLGLLRRKITG